MEKNNTNLILRYKNKNKEMKFFPKNFNVLKDYFLSIFNLKSSEEYIFKIYPNKNNNYILDEVLFNFRHIKKIKILKNPAIFIIDKDEQDYIEDIDKANLEYIENNNWFELQNIYKDYNLNKIKEELKRKAEVHKKLQERLNYIERGIDIIKDFPRIEGNNNLEDINKKYKEKEIELNKQLEELEKLKGSNKL